MTKEELGIAKKNMDSIREYRIVLSSIMKHPVSLEQAMVDWIEQRYYTRPSLQNTIKSGSHL